LPDPAFAKGYGAASLNAVLSVIRRRWLVRQAVLFLAVSGAVFALGLLVASRAVAAIAGVVAFVTLFVGRRQLSIVEAARAIEASAGPLDNLVVTAAELEERPRPVRAEIREAIAAQAAERLRAVKPSQVVPLAQPIGVTVLVAIGCVLLSGPGSTVLPGVIPGAPLDAIVSARPGSFDVRVVPPAYTGRKPETLRDPVQVSVIAGTRVQIPAANRDWMATESAALELVTEPGTPPRFLSVIVVPDLPPSIRIVAPGKDTAFAEPTGEVAVSIQTGDDLGLSALSLRFTKASGGGENVAFTEGEVALRIERRNAREWLGRADVSLDALGLEDGDILVYRAIARDTNPNGTPVQSDQYVIEIGKNAEIADAGFALPSEEKKYAISQQMVIYKTEQLLAGSREPGAGNRTAGSDDWLNESRGIAMEQRMVRAEVVFLGGGEVEDEVEEAAHSDELTEGRLQNTGRAEMLRAINAMSRAEAQLNDGRVKEALVFEREALVHLERALDRRRYFLRTLPDRSRIDATRRLTGERRDARSWDRDRQGAPAAKSIEAQRRVMRDLAAGVNVDSALAARLAAIDPASVELQNAAVALASATTDSAREVAARAAMVVLTDHALKSLPASAVVGVPRQ
jgi:hypothetical protein